jgi:hypothetical protein
MGWTVAGGTKSDISCLDFVRGWCGSRHTTGTVCGGGAGGSFPLASGLGKSQLAFRSCSGELRLGGLRTTEHITNSSPFASIPFISCLEAHPGMAWVPWFRTREHGWRGHCWSLFLY